MNISAALNKMEAKGWRFYPSGHNEYEWMKFAADGRRVGRGGDAIWKADWASACNTSGRTTNAVKSTAGQSEAGSPIKSHQAG